MKFNMEEEVEMLPHAKSGREESDKGMKKLSPEQKQKLEEAKSMLEALSSECGCSISDLIESDEGSEKSEGQGDQEEEGEESLLPPGAAGNDSDKSKKLALYIAQLKTKRG